MRLPKLKKKISAYILGEEGKISKQSMMAIGSLIGTAGLATTVEAIAKTCESNCGGGELVNGVDDPHTCSETNCYHANGLAGTYDRDTYEVIISHDNCVDHCSY